jgi:hypothetical protein
MPYRESTSPLLALQNQMKSFARFLRGREGRLLAAVVAEGALDPEVGQAFRDHWVKPRRDDAKKLLGRAIEAGELRSDADLDTVLDELFGPLYYRLLVNHAPLDPSFAENIFRTVMAAVASPRSLFRMRSSALRSAATSE